MGFERSLRRRHSRMPGNRLGDEAITPRHTIDYIAATLAVSPVARCLTQQIFYRLRRGLRCVLATDVAFRPSTALRAIVRKGDWSGLWSRIREVAGDPCWPEHVPWKGWLIEGPETLRELTLHVAIHLPPPDRARGESWTRERIELIVRRVV